MELHMTKLILDEDFANLVREKASQKGYDDPKAYLLDLVTADEEDADAENQKIRADLKLAFQQAVKGKTISREELRRRMAEEINS
jgi:hypothetical protein